MSTRPWRKILARILRIGARVFGAACLLGIVLLGTLQFDGVSTWVVGRLARTFNPYPGTTLTVERASGSWIRSLRLEGVRLTATAGPAEGDGAPQGSDRPAGPSGARVPEFTLDSLDVRFRLLPLLLRRFEIRTADVRGLRAELTQSPDSVWDVVPPSRGTGRDTGGSGFALRAGPIRVRNASVRVTFAPGDAAADRMDVEELDLSVGRLEAGAGGLTARLDTLHARFLPPGERLDRVVLDATGSISDGRVTVGGVTLRSGASDVTASGTLLLPGKDGGEVEDIDFRLRAAPLAFRDLSGFLRTLDPAVNVEVDLSVQGRASRVELSGDGTFSDGGHVEVEGAFTPFSDGPVEYRLTADAQDLRPATFLGEGSFGGVVNGRVVVNLEGADLAHVGGDVSARVEGLVFEGRAIRPVELSGGFTDGEADLEADAGVDGVGRVRLSVGGRPLDAAPSLRLEGGFRQRADATSGMGPLEQLGILDLDVRFAFETSGFSVDAAVARFTVEPLGGSLRGQALGGGTVEGSWSGGGGTFEVRQPLGEGSLTTTGEVAWRPAAGRGAAPGRVLSYSLPDIVLRDVDASRLLGDTAGSRVNAWASLTGVGTDPSTLEADLVVRLGASDFRGMALDSAVARVGARPTADRTRVVLDSLRFSGFHPASVAGVGSEFNGVARARMEGLDPRTGTLSGRLTLTPSRIGDAVVDSGEVVLSLAGGDLQLSGQIASTGGTLHVEGGGHPFAQPLDFRLDEGRVRALDLGSLLGRGGVESDLNLDFVIAGSVGSLEALEGSGQVVWLPSTLNTGSIQGGTVTLEAGGGRGSARAQLQTGRGQATFLASAPLGESLDSVGAEGTVDVRDLGDFLGRPELEVEARGDVSATWTVADGLAFTSDLQGRVGEATIDTLKVAGSFGGAVLRLDTLRLRSTVVHADGQGRWALQGSPGGAGSDLRVTATVQDLSPLGPLFGMGEVAGESGQGDIHLRGPSDAPSVVASLDLGPWSMKGVAGDSVHARAEYASDELTLTMRAVGPRGRGAVDLELSADPRPDEARGVIQRLDIATPGAQWALEAPVPISWKSGARVDRLVMASPAHGRLSVDGSIDPRGTQDLTVTLEGATLSGLARLLGRDDLVIQVDGRAHLTGPAASPMAEGDLSVELALPEGKMTSMDARFVLADGVMTLDAQAVDTAGGEVTLKGAVPLAISLAARGDSAAPSPASTEAVGPADITLMSRDFDISWARALFPEGTVADLAGRLTADVRASGPSDNLEWQGRIDFTEGMIRLGAAGTSYRDVRVSAEVRNRQIRIAEASVLSGSGSARVEGSAALDGFRIGELDLTAVMDRFLAWNGPLASATLTGDLSLSGRPEEPRLAGTLNVEGSKLGLDGVSSGSELEAVELTEEDYQMLEDYFGYRVQRTTEVAPSALLEATALDLSVRFDRDVWVNRSRQPTIAMEIQGDLDITKEPGGDVRATGTIETVPGHSYFRQFGRRFAVREGQLILAGPLSDFSFRMNAEWSVASHSNPDQDEVVVNLVVVGDAETLDLTLSSDPEMDEADIVSYLATGQPQSALVSSDADAPALGGLGASMAAGALGGALEEWAGDAVNLDVIEVQVDPVKGTILIAGRYVSPDLYVGFRQPVTFSESSSKTRTQNQTSEAEVEYRWFRWLTLNVQGGASEIRAFLKARHAY